MAFRKWEDLPDFMRSQEVYPFYLLMFRKRKTLILKRAFDLMAAMVLIILLMPVFIIVSVWIKLDSRGPAIFKQKRVTQFGRVFCIYKFRSMRVEEDDSRSQITTSLDLRITRAGRIIRKMRLDEIPQLVNILLGDMSFVGTRPEVPEIVAHYSDIMNATLLLPAGVTSEASIRYRDESNMIQEKENAAQIYIEKILPGKMEINLLEIRNISLLNDLRIMLKTVISVLH